MEKPEKEKTQDLNNMQDINLKILLLLLVDILEPVTYEELCLSSDKLTGREDIHEILDSLKEDGFIAEEQNHFRVTLSGLKMSISRKSATLRDISRMKHLIYSSRQGGGESVGR